jgi:hypothetical protein
VVRICEVDGALALPGSELLVIAGEVGGLPAGTYAIVPPGVLRGAGLVATAPLDAAPVVRSLDDLEWRQTYRDVHQATLHRDHAWFTRLTRMPPGKNLHDVAIADGEDIVLLGGDFHDGTRDLEGIDHVSYPPGSWHYPRTDGGCILLVRSPVPPRVVEYATLAVYEIAAVGGFWFYEEFDGFGKDAAWMEPLNDVCSIALGCSPHDEDWCDARFADITPRAQHVHESEGLGGVEAFYLACVAGLLDLHAELAPARHAGPAFEPVRRFRELAVPGPHPIARAFAAEYVALCVTRITA